MKAQIKYIIAIFIVLVFGYLGYVLSQKGEITEPGSSPDTTAPPSETTPNGQEATGEFLAYEKPEEILVSPPDDAPEAVKNRYSRLMVLLSTPTDSVMLKDCVSDPLVPEVQFGQTLLVKNADAVEHRIIHGTLPPLNIPSNGEAEIVVSEYFGMVEGEQGFFGYACDDGPSGIFHVVL